jgi:hypothetical protein
MDDIPSGWRTQVSSGVFWVASGLCVGGFDIYNGWRFGAKLSPVIGLIFAAAGVFVMVLRGRDWLTRISLWGCLLVTITAGYAAYTTDLGGALGNDGAQHNRYQTALSDAEKARKKLSSIKEEGAVKDLEKKQEVAEARKKIDCRRAKSDECMKDERDLTDLLDHLSAARARDKAETALKEAGIIIGEGPGQSLATGTAPAQDAPHEIAGIPVLYIIIGALFVAQAGALRTMHGLELIRSGWQAWKQETTIEPDESELLEQEIAKGIVAPQSPEEKAFDRVAIFAHRKGGTQGKAKNFATFAASVKTSPSSLKRYLESWDSRGITQTTYYEGNAIRVRILKQWSAAESTKLLRRIRRRA